ncbi:hypothetical protein [Amycolatopsis albispora]|uniref:Uncharacterized protein n=1 Tax=Amycolatopsis albispora TaxID=1804986 RepID=A0A344L6C2_9PSEU|nr:hypothetical protein [Amycolatopsis albispora]AXB43596.1 hypothetical protein A4R43_14495 [Amycolatopsis albispora]
MTVYSDHANRGKVQILATYQGPAGVTSATVTSVEDLALAAPIVGALNRISACATVPVSVWDDRRGRFDEYPADHLAALTDRDARPSLLTGTHSLWYEHAMVFLHRALADLDTAAAAAPPPVRTAIGAELAAEARALRDELAEHREGVEPPESGERRSWEFEAPFVVIDETVSGLGQRSRDALTELDRGLDQTEREQAVADLRLLLDAYLRCSNDEAQLLLDGFEISDDPDDGYHLNIQAPMPGGKWERTGWNVELCRWVPDDDGASGEPVLHCALPDPPSVPDLVSLLNHSNGRADVLAGWAETPVGEALAGTSLAVTNRYE